MPSFSVELRDDVTRMTRRRGVDAPTASVAAAMCEAMEDNIVRYSLLHPRDPVLSQRENGDGLDMTVNRDVLAPIAAEHGHGHDLLAYLARDYTVERGKVTGPVPAIRGHLAMHHQQEPFRVVSVKPVVPTVDDLVSALAWLHGDPAAWDEVTSRLQAEGVPVAAVTAGLFPLSWQTNIDGSAATVWGTGSGGNAIKTSLHSAYTYTIDTHHFFSDASATEVAATGGYSTGGVTLGTKTSNYDSATDQIRLGAANVSWTSSTISATDAIVTNTTPGSAATNPMLAAVDFGGTVSTTNGTFQITWDATGIVVFDCT